MHLYTKFERIWTTFKIWSLRDCTSHIWPISDIEIFNQSETVVAILDTQQIGKGWICSIPNLIWYQTTFRDYRSHTGYDEVYNSSNLGVKSWNTNLFKLSQYRNSVWMKFQWIPTVNKYSTTMTMKSWWMDAKIYHNATSFTMTVWTSLQCLRDMERTQILSIWTLTS